RNDRGTCEDLSLSFDHRRSKRTRVSESFRYSELRMTLGFFGSMEKQEVAMNWDQIEGNWKQFKGKIKERWGKLTDDELDVIRGNRDRLLGKLQERYGIAKEEAEKQLEEFRREGKDKEF